MELLRSVVAAVAACVLLTGCVSSGTGRVDDAHARDVAAHAAPDAYVAAINSNNLEAVLDMLTDDVVFMAPNTPILVGKDAVRQWAAPYLEAYEIQWKKTSLEFIVLGDWAIQQYAYVEDDKPKGDGPRLQDVGKGIIIYRRDRDGQWRVARDAWNSDQPLPQ